MKLYRAHIKTLPTWASLNRYRDSTLHFKSCDGCALTASITKDNKLVLTIDHGDGLLQDTTHVLDDDLIVARKFTKQAVLLAYTVKMTNRSLIEAEAAL